MRDPIASVHGSEFEPSAWLRAVEADRLADIDAAGLADSSTTLMVPLSGVGTTPGSRDDRTCDRCRCYVREGQRFLLLVLRSRPHVLLVGGLCERCHQREVGGGQR